MQNHKFVTQLERLNDKKELTSDHRKMLRMAYKMCS